LFSEFLFEMTILLVFTLLTRMTLQHVYKTVSFAIYFAIRWSIYSTFLFTK